jgi:tetratricopeptide (TPR) repeat protein
VKKKIAHVFYLMKDWGQAYQEYIKVPLSELSEAEKNEMLESLYFDISTFDRLSELSKIAVQTGTTEYFRLVDTCYGAVADCVNAIEAYTGSEYRILTLKSQIRDAAKISPDIQYRNLSLGAKFYEQRMYRATENIIATVLADRPDYAEGLKMLGFSLYELGNYEGAKKYILEYLDKNPRDIESIVRMGEVSSRLGDYVASNLYYNNAITAGYKKKTDIERLLAYNYARLSDTVGMIKVLSYLLAEPDVTEDDYAVGISTAIMDGQYARAESWAKSGLERFPDSHIITPLYIQSLRLLSQTDSASAIIQNTPIEVMKANPTYLLEKAILTFEIGDVEGAKDLFRELI